MFLATKDVCHWAVVVSVNYSSLAINAILGHVAANYNLVGVARRGPRNCRSQL